MMLSKFIGEATGYDKKEKLEEKRPKSWLKSVSAFANGTGGALIFGVSDDESLIGLVDAKSDSEKISEIIKTKMDPIPQINLEIYSEDGKEFIILNVLAGQETPYYFVSDGGRVAYVRIGNESVPTSATELKRLVLRGSNFSFDSIPSRYLLESLSFTKLRSVYRMRTGNELTVSDFVSFELMDESHTLTNAGALLADDSPIRYSRLFCTRWHGLDKASGIMDALDDKEFSGSLVSLLQNGIEFVKNNTKKRWKKTGNGRIEMPEYPEQAVHEAIVNALIHRDYMEIGSEVHIDIFDNRMEIYSPGGMFDGSIVQELDTDNIASKRRNPVIADIFSRMHFMERRGSGFKKIKADYRRATNYRIELEPVFCSTPTSFFVTLYNLNYNVPVEKTELSNEKQAFDDVKTELSNEKQAFEIIIAGLDFTVPTKENILKIYLEFGNDTVFSRKDIMEIINLTATPTTELIRKMKVYGLIEPIIGQGKGKYRFVNFAHSVK